MDIDLEKADVDASRHVPQDLDGPVEHPGVSTILDDEVKMGDGPEHKHEHEEHDSEADDDHSSSSPQRRPSTPTLNDTPPEDGKVVIQPSISRSASEKSRALIIVPHSQRRGLLARFVLIPEVERPYDYSVRTKWLLTALVALAAAAAPMGSAIFLPALPQLSHYLQVSPTIANLSVAMYMLSMSIFPLWWSSFSETLGRRTIYIISFASFTVWNIVAAESRSIAMLIVMRILAGGSAASVQAVGAGTIADIWETYERGRAMGYFYLGPLLGPLLAPIIGGALAEKWGWRSTQWFQVIYGGILWLVLTLCLPETLLRRRSNAAPAASSDEVPPPPETSTTAEAGTSEQKAARPALTRVSTRQSIHVKTKRAAKIFKRCFIDPLSVLLYLRFPAVFLSVYLASVTFGSLYVLNISIQHTFSSSHYDYRVIIVGLLYIPNSLGYFLASIIGGRWTDVIMAREARKAGRYDAKGKLIYRPEDRIRENAWLAAIMFPGALIWYGWTAKYGLIWIVPMIANFFFGVGSMIIFGCVTTMLTEFMPRRSSSGVAVNNFVRNIFSCVGGIVAQPLINALGNGWLFAGLGVISYVSSFFVIWAMKKFGPRWRTEMDRKLNSWV